MFLRCDNCKEIFPLEVTEERAIYERENVYIPEPKREERARELNYILDSAKDKGELEPISHSSGDKGKSKIGFLRFLCEYFDF